MEIEITITPQPIDSAGSLPQGLVGAAGALVEFAGVVRGEENDQAIAALEYEAYEPMAGRVMREILDDLGQRHPCLWAQVIHRVGVVPVGECAIRVRAAAGHREQAFALVMEFMNRLKQDVPIWKCRALRAPDQPNRARP